MNNNEKQSFFKGKGAIGEPIPVKPALGNEPPQHEAQHTDGGHIEDTLEKIHEPVLSNCAAVGQRLYPMNPEIMREPCSS